ncbi:MAG: hypothetical protein ACHRXM_22290 [Isosphaerales bacterium]
MDLEKILEKVPWITKDGFFDPTKYPIEGALKQALSEDRQKSRSGLNLLQAMHTGGRKEAGVLLLGLLASCGDHWERRIAIVEALQGFDTKPCADFLFGEFKRVKSSNTTRRYLGAVIKVLSTMRPKLVEAGFESLADDKSFTPKMRDKFRAVFESRFLDEDDW